VALDAWVGPRNFLCSHALEALAPGSAVLGCVAALPITQSFPDPAV